MQLATDARNAAECQRFSVTCAARHYRAMRRDGYTARSARAQAIAYLMRKTHWDWPFAAGAFDRHMRDHAREE